MTICVRKLFRMHWSYTQGNRVGSISEKIILVFRYNRVNQRKRALTLGLTGKKTILQTISQIDSSLTPLSD